MRNFLGHVPMVRVPLLPVVAFLMTLASVACSSRPSQDPGPLALQPPIADPVIKVIAPETSPGLSFLSWDTEGGEKAATNLLRAGSAVRVQFQTDGAWQDAKIVNRRIENGGEAIVYELEIPEARLEWRIESGNGSLKLALNASSGAAFVRLLFPFDPKVTSTTVLPATGLTMGPSACPRVLNAPDWGPMLVTELKGRSLIGRLEGSRSAKIVDLTLDIPAISPDAPITLSLTPLLLPAPPGLRSTSLWLAARRGWLNALQPCARWGEQNKPFSAPPGILGNNVISDPASCSLWFYADQAFWTPELAPGISVMPLVRRTIDCWLDQRMRRDADGRLPARSLATGTTETSSTPTPGRSSPPGTTSNRRATSTWLGRRIERLELIADFLARRDVDGDGMVEATQSGNRGTLVQPNRSCAWWDALNCGHKDGYTNALIYRAWRCLADLERKLGRADEPPATRASPTASRPPTPRPSSIPKTGWLAWWKSADGELHDYASPTLNGLAIEYGLVEPAHGRADPRPPLEEDGRGRLHALRPRRAADARPGPPERLPPARRRRHPRRARTARTPFGHYMNGGITAGHVLHFLAAHYVVGERRAGRPHPPGHARAPGRAASSRTASATPAARASTGPTGTASPTGYEGYLADSFRFLQAVLLREEPFRAKLYHPLQSD